MMTISSYCDKSTIYQSGQTIYLLHTITTYDVPLQKLPHLRRALGLPFFSPRGLKVNDIPFKPSLD